FDKVIVLCVDRLGRDVTEAIISRKELDRRGTPLEFVTQSFDGTPEGELQYTIFAAFAQYERAVIKRRMSEGRIRRVRSGKYQLGTVPYGYRYLKCICPERKCAVADHGTLIEREEQAKVVRQMFRWAANGDGDIAIATRLN